MPEIIAKRRSLNNEVKDLQLENQKLRTMLKKTRGLANLGLVSSMIGHEINNVLTPLANYSQLALNNPEDIALSTKAHNKTVKNCERARLILEKLRDAVNDDKTNMKSCDVQKLINNSFDCVSRDFSKDGIIVNITVEPGLQLDCVAVDVERVLINLILNARDAMLGKGGRLDIDAYTGENGICFEVSDTGCGIEKESLKEIFQPFHSTKTDDNTASGTGLGLAFCKQVIEEYDGVIAVESKLGKGTKFKITFPNTPNLG